MQSYADANHTCREQHFRAYPANYEKKEYYQAIHSISGDDVIGGYHMVDAGEDMRQYDEYGHVINMGTRCLLAFLACSHAAVLQVSVFKQIYSLHQGWQKSKRGASGPCVAHL